MPKANEPGARATEGAGTAAPLPAKPSTAAPLLASDDSVSVALRVPVAAGVKLKLSVQLAPAASVPPGLQVPPRAKSEPAVPVSVNAPKVSVAAPLLLTEMLCAALVVPTTCEAKVNVDALSEIAGCGATVP